MPHVIFPEYRDQFKSTKYPFADTATLTSVNRDFVFPQDIFCDASVYIPGATAPIYISELNINSSGSYLTITDYSKKYTATGKIEPLSDKIELYNPRNNQVGIIVATKDLSYFTSAPKGEYSFVAKDTSLAPRCTIYLKDTGVTSVGVDGGEQLEGDVWICGRDGVIVRYVNEQIRVDIVGEPLFKREDPKFRPPTFVQTINDMSADRYGNFNISPETVDDIIRVTTTPNGITISAAGV